MYDDVGMKLYETASQIPDSASSSGTSKIPWWSPTLVQPCSAAGFGRSGP